MTYKFLLFDNTFFLMILFLIFLFLNLRFLLIFIVMLEMFSLIFLYKLLSSVLLYSTSLLLFSIGIMACEASFGLTILVVYYSLSLEDVKKFFLSF